MNRRGFTLIELMITVAVLVTLMGLVFRLGSIGGEQEARSITIKRLQCVENALSGYYAAFGSYPPVKLHGSRDIYLKTNDYGIQEDSEISTLNWSSVNAACRSQPIAARYPFSSDEGTKNWIRAIAEELKRRSQSDDSAFAAYKANAAILQNGFDSLERPDAEVGDTSATDWRDVQIFKFGLLSYLLPRYLFMTLGEDECYTKQQWMANNEDQVDCAGDGESTYDYKQMKRDIQGGHWRYVAMLPSQAVCARWMPNFAGIICCGSTFFGINTHEAGTAPISVSDPNPEIFCPTENRSNQYVLNGMSIRDGWWRDLYYYSPSPYQSYRLWSAGSNGKTFPPWIDLSSLQGSDRETAASWMSDDVENLTH